LKNTVEKRNTCSITCLESTTGHLNMNTLNHLSQLVMNPKR